MSNVFEKILSGELPCAKLYENEKIFSFMDAFPQSYGHALIIPKYTASDIFSIPDEYISAIAIFSKQLSQAQKKALKPDGIRIMQFNGTAAGQTVFHYHMHVIPVWFHRIMNEHADKSVPLEQLEDTAQLIKDVLYVQEN